jgi:hypothetical protein
MKDMSINLHEVFSLLSECDRFEFLKREVSSLTLQQQGELVVEAFTDMQNYIDMSKMKVEVLQCDEEVYSITQFN